MDNIIKVSVIVPVYNVELYLNRCIESIVTQTYTNLEIILVDDGSTDNSGKLCDEWARKDNRIKVVHKKNAGLGFARNTGLDHANGDYVVYIDSDDYVAENMIETLLTALTKNKADTVYCGLNRVFPEGRIVEQPSCYDNLVFEKEDIINMVLLEMVGTVPEKYEDNYVVMSVWHGIYSMDLIRRHHIRFPSERQFMSEDIIYHIDYLKESQKVVYIKDCLYNYRMNPFSLSLKFDINRLERHKILYAEVIRRLGEFLPEEQYIHREQRRFLGGVRGYILSIAASDQHKKIKIIRSVCKDEIVRNVILQYPYHRNPFRHKIINSAIRHKHALLLFLLAYAQNKKKPR